MPKTKRELDLEIDEVLANPPSQARLTGDLLNDIIEVWASQPPRITWTKPLKWTTDRERPGWLTASISTVGAYEIGRAIMQVRPDLKYDVTERRGTPIAINVGAPLI